jgi:hypothetical protein
MSDDVVSSSDDAQQRASDLIDNVENLAGKLRTIIATGVELYDSTGWEGNQRNNFADLWGEEGDSGGGANGSIENGTSVSAVLNGSIASLESISEDADISTGNIRTSDGIE